MYLPTIGLEIHAELKTQTKMFCGCPNDGTERVPNKNTCPICLGHPGTLPTINKEAVKKVIRVGFALRGTIATHSQFDRKSYFYPDLPKGYQISQYEFPIVKGGILNGVRITRVHLEEDAGKLVHADPYKSAHNQHKSASLVDFNRAGVPLMELVTEPDIKNADEAVAFARELQLILKYLGASDANMENGQMRIEANISLMPANVPRISQIPAGKEREYIRDIGGQFVHVRELGNKVEVKNINSFKAVHDAIAFEIKRQEKVLSEGKKVVQETRGWNDAEGVTESQRTKEGANDYRYFPEPDLPPLNLQELFDLDALKAETPELPEAKRRRFVQEFGIAKDQIEVMIYEPPLANYFEAAASELAEKTKKPDYQLLANYLLSDLKGQMSTQGIHFESVKISPEHLAHLIGIIQGGKISSRIAKDLLVRMIESGEDPENLMKTDGMELISDQGALGTVADEVIAANEKSVADYKNGKEQALQFLVGQMMAKTNGKADPEGARKALINKLKS